MQVIIISTEWWCSWKQQWVVTSRDLILSRSCLIPLETEEMRSSYFLDLSDFLFKADFLASLRSFWMSASLYSTRVSWCLLSWTPDGLITVFSRRETLNTLGSWTPPSEFLFLQLVRCDTSVDAYIVLSIYSNVSIPMRNNLIAMAAVNKHPHPKSSRVDCWTISCLKDFRYCVFVKFRNCEDCSYLARLYAMLSESQNKSDEITHSTNLETFQGPIGCVAKYTCFCVNKLHKEKKPLGLAFFALTAY